MLIDEKAFRKAISDRKVLEEMISEHGEEVDIPYREYTLDGDLLGSYLFGDRDGVVDKAVGEIFLGAGPLDDLYREHLDFLAAKGIAASGLSLSAEAYESPSRFIEENYPKLFALLEDKVRDNVSLIDYPEFITPSAPWVLAFSVTDPSIPLDNGVPNDFVPRQIRENGKVMDIESSYTPFEALEIPGSGVSITPVGSRTVRKVVEKIFEGTKSREELASLLGTAQMLLEKYFRGGGEANPGGMSSPEERGRVVSEALAIEPLAKDFFLPDGEMTDYGMEIKKAMDSIFAVYDEVKDWVSGEQDFPMSDFLRKYKVERLYGDESVRRAVRTLGLLCTGDSEEPVFEMEGATDSMLSGDPEANSRMSPATRKIDEALLNTTGAIDSILAIVPSRSFSLDEALEVNRISYRESYREDSKGKRVSSGALLRLPKGTELLPFCGLNGSGGVGLSTEADVELFIGGENGLAPIVQPIDAPIGYTRTYSPDEVYGFSYQYFEEQKPAKIQEISSADEIREMERASEAEMQLLAVKKRMLEAVSGDNIERGQKVVDMMIKHARENGMRSFFGDLAYDAETLDRLLRDGATKMVWAVRESGSWSMPVDDQEYIWENKLEHIVKEKGSENRQVSPFAVPANFISGSAALGGKTEGGGPGQKIYLVDFEEETPSFIEISTEDVRRIVKAQGEAAEKIFEAMKKSEHTQNHPDFGRSIDKVVSGLNGEKDAGRIRRLDARINYYVTENKVISMSDVRSIVVDSVRGAADEIRREKEGERREAPEARPSSEKGPAM